MTGRVAEGRKYFLPHELRSWEARGSGEWTPEAVARFREMIENERSYTEECLTRESAAGWAARWALEDLRLSLRWDAPTARRYEVEAACLDTIIEALLEHLDRI